MPVISKIVVLTTKSLRLMADDSQEICSGYKQTTQVKVWCVEQMISRGSPIPLWEPIRGSLTHKQHPVGRPCWGGWPSLGLHGTYRTRTELLEMEQPTVEGLPPTIRTEEVVATVSDSVKMSPNCSIHTINTERYLEVLEKFWDALPASERRSGWF